MRIPTIHLNGTSAEHLREAYTVAYRKLGDAIEAVEATSPNGRDFYLQGGDAIREATSEHLARVHALSTVRDEMLEIVDAIDEQSSRAPAP
jgi:hypothetical protein